MYTKLSPLQEQVLWHFISSPNHILLKEAVFLISVTILLVSVRLSFVFKDINTSQASKL